MEFQTLLKINWKIFLENYKIVLPFKLLMMYLHYFLHNCSIVNINEVNIHILIAHELF